MKKILTLVWVTTFITSTLHASGFIEGQVSSSWVNLPTELHFAIFKYVKDKDLINSREVCKEWKQLASDPSLWRNRPFNIKNITLYLNLPSVRTNLSVFLFMGSGGRMDEEKAHILSRFTFLTSLNIMNNNLGPAGLQALHPLMSLNTLTL